MDRAEGTAVVLELAGRAPIVSSVGNATFDLYAADRDRAENFYIWNSMGMASSVGLGLALARPDLRVVVLDGDGALLMNLGSLATASVSGARNLVHVVWDNGGWEITGGQPAGTAYGIDLETVARGCGFTRTASVSEVEALRSAFGQAMQDTGSWFILARVAGTGAAHLRPTKTLTVIRERVIEALRR
ncbi:MAG: sulfopyruvate decarboxylase subunit beta [Chloroflexi bacterium]|nr:sulfopyruvate decarboxylase subunit beta [Chloroflexota bacterium]